MFIKMTKKLNHWGKVALSQELGWVVGGEGDEVVFIILRNITEAKNILLADISTDQVPLFFSISWLLIRSCESFLTRSCKIVSSYVTWSANFVADLCSQDDVLKTFTRPWKTKHWLNKPSTSCLCHIKRLHTLTHTHNTCTSTQNGIYMM